MKELKLKINNVRGFGGVVTIQTDQKGVPLDKFWRNRLKDAEIDNCVEIVKPRAPKAKKQEIDE